MNSLSVYQNEQILTNQTFELLYSELRNNNCLPKLKKISKTRKAKRDHAFKAGPPSTSEASTCSERFSASGLQQVATRKAKHDHAFKDGPPSTSETSTCGEMFSSGMQQVATRKAKRDHAFKDGPQSTSETSMCGEMFSSGMQQVATRKGRLVKDHAFDLRPPSATKCGEMFPSRPSPLHDITSSDYGVAKNKLTPWSDSSTFQSDTSNAYDGSISESSTGQPVDSEYQDLGSPSVNGSLLDTLEVSIIGYSGLEYDSVGDLFMMHKPRRHRCQLKSKKLNLKRLWAIAKYVKQSRKPSKSNIFLKRNLCKREFSAYMNSMKNREFSAYFNSMKNSFKKVNKSSNKKGKHTSNKKKADYKDIGHKKIKLDMEMTEGDYESEDGIDIVKIWRKKEPPEKGQKWMGKATEKRNYSNKDKTNRSAKNKSNTVSKKSGSGYESEDGIDIVKIWRKNEPPEKGQSDGQKWMGKATEKRKYSNKDKTNRSAKNKSKKVLTKSRSLSVSQEKVSQKFPVKSTAVDDITVGTTLAPKSVAVCLPRKKVAKSEKALEDNGVSGLFKPLFSNHNNNNLGKHYGAVWKEIVSEDSE